MKITNQDIKKAKAEMKHRKQYFQRTCRDYKEDNESKQREKDRAVCKKPNHHQRPNRETNQGKH